MFLSCRPPFERRGQRLLWQDGGKEDDTMKRRVVLAMLLLAVIAAAVLIYFRHTRMYSETDPFILNDAAYALASAPGRTLRKGDLERMLDLEQRALKHCEKQMIPKAVQAVACYPGGNISPFFICRAASGDDHELRVLIEENIEGLSTAIEEMGHK
jgi:hypothetical protein